MGCITQPTNITITDLLKDKCRIIVALRETENHNTVHLDLPQTPFQIRIEILKNGSPCERTARARLLCECPYTIKRDSVCSGIMSPSTVVVKS